MPAAVAVPIAAAVIGAGATVYSVEAQKSAAAKQREEQERLAKMQQDNIPKLPNTADLGASVKRGQALAQSAGGTITSDQTQNRQIGSGQTTGQRTLLGA